jgi:nucleoside-specific channel-forming protein
MRNVKTLALAATTLAALSGTAFAADYSDGLHKNDYKWSQFNLMYSIGEKPAGDGNKRHDYLEMEFGGRSGVVDLYGYVDVFNLANKSSSSSDKNEGDANKIYMKLAPRFSLDGMTGKDLSFGPVQEVYLATLFNIGGGIIAEDTNNAFVGLGSDVMVPWLGKVGMNLYGLYEVNNKDWNGAQFSMNWFKPFVNFDNGSFISYQGYIDYQFAANTGPVKASSGGAMFNGIYWHSEHYSVGYGLKAYNDVYTLNFDAASGISHYFAATYKF